MCYLHVYLFITHSWKAAVIFRNLSLLFFIGIRNFNICDYHDILFQTLSKKMHFVKNSRQATKLDIPFFLNFSNALSLTGTSRQTLFECQLMTGRHNIIWITGTPKHLLNAMFNDNELVFKSSVSEEIYNWVEHRV